MPSQTYKRKPNGQLYRQLAMGWLGYGWENWDPARRVWRVVAGEPEGAEEISATEASQTLRDPRLLEEPGEGTGLIVGLPPPERLPERGRWLVERIAETQGHVSHGLGEFLHEMTFQVSGTPDAEYEYDVLDGVEAAYATLCALWDELRELQAVTVKIVRDAVDQGVREPPKPGEYWE